MAEPYFSKLILVNLCNGCGVLTSRLLNQGAGKKSDRSTLLISRFLTVLVIVLAVLSVSAVLYSQYFASASYNSSIKYAFEKSPLAYDYSCDQNDQQIYFVIKNEGPKLVSDLSFSLSNPLCKGSLPLLPKTLNASSTLDFYAQSATQNGTLTISGNNTFIMVSF